MVHAEAAVAQVSFRNDGLVKDGGVGDSEQGVAARR